MEWHLSHLKQISEGIESYFILQTNTICLISNCSITIVIYQILHKIQTSKLENILLIGIYINISNFTSLCPEKKTYSNQRLNVASESCQICRTYEKIISFESTPSGMVQVAPWHTENFQYKVQSQTILIKSLLFKVSDKERCKECY